LKGDRLYVRKQVSPGIAMPKERENAACPSAVAARGAAARGWNPLVRPATRAHSGIGVPEQEQWVEQCCCRTHCSCSGLPSRMRTRSDALVLSARSANMRSLTQTANRRGSSLDLMALFGLQRSVAIALGASVLRAPSRNIPSCILTASRKGFLLDLMAPSGLPSNTASASDGSAHRGASPTCRVPSEKGKNR
jgi:hypothetical protein